MENFLSWWMVHNPQIIQWLIAGIVFVSAVVLGFGLFRRPQRSVESVDQFESTLKRILEQSKSATVPSSRGSFSGADHVPTAAELGSTQASLPPDHPAAAMGAGGGATVVSSMQDPELINKLAENQKRIETLSKQVADTEPQRKKLTEFEAKIKELEGKLSEYEIIEDDIADLSFYKEENAKLKAQLGMPADAKSADAPLADFEKTVGANQIADEVVKANMPAATPATPPPAAAPAAAPSAVPASAVPVTKPVQEADDLFSEFANDMNSLQDELNTGIDTDKMLSEVADLSEGGDATFDADGASDIDKMAQEAMQLTQKK